MIVQLKKPESLTPSDLIRWLEIIEESGDFSSPYFHPDFTLAVAQCRDDVEVAVFSFEDRTVGFFPYQRAGNVARPVGGMLSDAHGIIHSPDSPISVENALALCGLSAWHFHYQIESQIPEASWQPDVELAAVMNLEGGFEAYVSRLESKNVVKQTDRKARKLSREHGTIRFEWNSSSQEAFDQLIEWKSAQYESSDIADVFSFDWTRKLLQSLWRNSDGQLRGLLSVMFVDDRPVAVHFGLQANGVLHQWFPAYDPKLRDYSPGMIHLMDMARHGEEQGVERIDLGRTCHYKSRVATHTTKVAEGCVDLRPVHRLLRQGYHQTFEWLRHSPLRAVARVPGRMLRRLSEQRQFQ